MSTASERNAKEVCKITPSVICRLRVRMQFGYWMAFVRGAKPHLATAHKEAERRGAVECTPRNGAMAYILRRDGREQQGQQEAAHAGATNAYRDARARIHFWQARRS